MALKALLLKKQIDNQRKQLKTMHDADAGFLEREAELSASIEEVETDEQRSEVEQMIAQYEQEKTEHENAIGELERSISELETKLAAEEAAQNTEPDAAPANEGGDGDQRKDERKMSTRMKNYGARYVVFGDMTRGEVQEMLQREDMQQWLSDIRAVLGQEKRAINNVGLTIPEVALGILRENELRYSKLTRHIDVMNVRGEASQLISDPEKEAVWTECCANLNELSLTFYQSRFGCWKVGGFFTVCNANLEDSDIDLAAEVFSSLGQSIGYTNDKTCLYGTGSNMPLGIVTRLAQTSKPGTYPATARPWVDLHTSNIKTIANTYTGIALFQQLALAAGNANGDYSRGEKVWVMNDKTYGKIVANAMNIDASGAITSGVNGTMPVLGGIIEVLPASIVPDDNIVYGYFDLYRKANRAGERYAQSEHVRFLNDETVFKGTARWDGLPVIAEAFVLIGIDGTNPTTSVAFRGDGANAPTSVWLPATATVAKDATITLKPVLGPYGVKTTFTWNSATQGKATVSDAGVVTGVAAGSSVITVTTENGLTAQCTVTVTGE